MNLLANKDMIDFEIGSPFMLHAVDLPTSYLDHYTSYFLLGPLYLNMGVSPAPDHVI